MPLDIPAILESIPLGKGVRVISFHPGGLVALNKPTGVLSHPNSSADQRRSLLNCGWSADRERYIWKNKEGKNQLFYLMHRLDSATSGVILGCVNPDLVKEIKKQFAKRRITKTYRAIVAGKPKNREEYWKDILSKQKSKSQLRVKSASQGSPAETEMKLMKTCKSKLRLSVLNLKPKTGKTHQLRVQCAKRNLPIIGDSTYGNFPLNHQIKKQLKSDRLFLHANSIRLSWQSEAGEERYSARADVPELFEKLMQAGL